MVRFGEGLILNGWASYGMPWYANVRFGRDLNFLGLGAVRLARAGSGRVRYGFQFSGMVS